MFRQKKKQAGFTLIELLVAVVILAVGLLGLVQLQVTAIKTNSQTMTSTAARSIAQKVVEEIAAMDADDPLFDGPGTGTWSNAPATVSPVTVAGGGTYNITYNVAQVQANGNDVSNLFNVEITVESTTEVMHVLGNRKRRVVINTLKRAI